MAEAGAIPERIESPLDGFQFEAWRQAPADARRGGLIAVSYTHLDVYKRQPHHLASAF